MAAITTYFQRLLTPFTTPEELFGAWDLNALERGKYERAVDGYLPTARVAFLDEIFKANSAILNSLLTMLNERAFDQGPKRIYCPLEVCVGASNEYPADASLDALYDRFLIRRWVSYVPTRNERLALLKAADPEQGVTCGMDDILIARNALTSAFIGRDAEIDALFLAVCSRTHLLLLGPPGTAKSLLGQVFAAVIERTDPQVLKFHQEQTSNVHVPDEVLNKLLDICEGLAQNHGIVVSDRRLRSMLKLIKASAYMGSRKTATSKDLMVLADSVWNRHDERASIVATILEHTAPALLEGQKIADAVREVYNEIGDFRSCGDLPARLTKVQGMEDALRDLDPGNDPDFTALVAEVTATRKSIARGFAQVSGLLRGLSG